MILGAARPVADAVARLVRPGGLDVLGPPENVWLCALGLAILGPALATVAPRLVRPLAEQQDVTTPSTAAASPLPTAPSSTVRRGETPVVPSATPSTPSPVTQRKTSSSESQQATTSTTRPCALITDRVATAVTLPPLCP